MKKLRLAIEDLEVSSHATTPAHGKGGTVQGMEETHPSFCGIVTCLYQCDTWGCATEPLPTGVLEARTCVPEYTCGNDCTGENNTRFHCKTWGCESAGITCTCSTGEVRSCP